MHANTCCKTTHNNDNLKIENYFKALLPAKVDLLVEKPSILCVHKLRQENT
jgi:hypothetical protein